MPARKDFVEMLGELATRFAALEFVVGSILALMVHEDELVTGAMIASELPTSRKVAFIDRLAALPRHTEERRERLRAFAKRAEKQLPLRNRFIHGFWTLRDAEMSEGSVTVVDLTPNAASAQNEWKVTRPHQYGLSELRDRFDSITQLTDEAVAIMKELNPDLWPGTDGDVDTGGASTV